MWRRGALVGLAVLAVMGSAFVMGGAAGAAQTTDGGLDTSFGDGGRVRTTEFPGTHYARSAGLQSTGRIVVGGITRLAGPNDFGLWRYNADGSLDPTFGVGGRVITDIVAGNDSPESLVILDDDRIVMVGMSSENAAQRADLAIVRYLPDGDLDLSFGGDGKVTTSVGTPEVFGAAAMAVRALSDGTLLVAGYSADGAVLLRYRDDGSLDTSFGGGDGLVEFAVAGFDTWFIDMAVDSQGRIIVAGTISAVAQWKPEYLVARFLSDGALDISFGVNGFVTAAVSPDQDYVEALTLQPDGRIVVAGYGEIDPGTPTAHWPFTMMRFTAQGAVDPTFGSGGQVITSFGHSYDQATSVILATDGKILVAGGADNGTDGDFALVRYRTDGSPDPSFGTSGVVTTDFGNRWDSGWAVLQQPDGKIVLVGDSGGQVAMARYAPAPPAPPAPPQVVEPPFVPPPTPLPEPVTLPTVTASADPGLAPGAVEVLIDGSSVEVDVILDGDGRYVLSGNGFELLLLGHCALSCADRDGADRPIPEWRLGSEVTVGATGYLPGSPLGVWMFSEPVSLGEATVGEDGRADVAAVVSGVPPGAHTLQISGLDTEGRLRTVNLGVLVAPAPDALPAVLPSTGHGSSAAVTAAVLLLLGLVAWSSGRPSSRTLRRAARP